MTVDDIEIEIHEESALATEHVSGRRRWPWIVAGTLGIAAVMALIISVTSDGDSGEVTETASLTTATVERTDVVATETLGGTRRLNIAASTAQATKGGADRSRA